MEENIIMVPPEENVGERGYKTTFYQDFSIAERFGIEAIKDTYNRAFGEWKSNCEYLTELVAVLNHKVWDWYNRNLQIAKVYEDLWKASAQYAEENLTGEELQYYYQETD